MMHPVTVRGTVIGDGMPVICVPIAEGDRSGILAAAEAIRTGPAGLAEWRADRFEHALDFRQVERVLRDLRDALGDLPLLLTWRTQGEGGDLPASPVHGKIAVRGKPRRAVRGDVHRRGGWAHRDLSDIPKA